MATIVTRAGKGAPLTHTEVDANFTNLNTDKLESGSTAASLTITSADINGGTIDGTVIGGSTPAAISGTTGTFSASGFPVQINSTNNNLFKLLFQDTSSAVGYIGASSTAAFAVGSSAAAELFRVDSSGNVGIGTSSPAAKLHSVSAVGDDAAQFTDNANYTLAVRRLTSSTGGMITGTAGSALGFGTNNTERMRITSGGVLLVGQTTNALADTGHILDPAGIAYHITSGIQALVLNRKTSDGNIVEFYQDGSIEGSISVSGTTVSYNGGHLARWSQTADNTRIELLKGTVMTNLDQMAVWGDEDNEQLNCMAVSSTEGDPNVAGVFVNWDNDDDEYTNDMNVAMTGDMIIRIAQGTTVQRGDLLMSAGNGTAKPQGDDIVRSKTIAKVTSTHVTCTYEDGSYCVPCVLMAC